MPRLLGLIAHLKTCIKTVRKPQLHGLAGLLETCNKSIYESAANGYPAVVIFHRDTNQMMRELAKQGAVKLYYSQEPSIHPAWGKEGYGGLEFYSVFGQYVYVTEQPGKAGASWLIRDPEFASSRMHKLQGIFEKSHHVPIDAIDDVFRMIDIGYDPSTITEFIKSEKNRVAPGKVDWIIGPDIDVAICTYLDISYQVICTG
ncbi:MAG: hypothetical protein ABIG95_00280 [Candidatus Woesearchaeota archaeon]